MDNKNNVEATIAVKLDVLIEDFQRFRQEQMQHNKASINNTTEESKLQAKILTTQNWHTVIGSFMMGIIMYLLYLHAKGVS